MNSKYGNGKAAAGRQSERSPASGAQTEVRHINDVKPRDVGAADLYAFSAPTRLGKMIGSMKRFLKRQGYRLVPNTP
jgi:menaquinone-dependent protoporphyrinogen IX oxidase